MAKSSIALQRSWVQILIPTSADSQLPPTEAPTGFWENLHSCAWVYAYTDVLCVCRWLWKLEDRVGSSEAGIFWCVCWEPNSSLLQEKHTLLTTKPSISPVPHVLLLYSQGRRLFYYTFKQHISRVAPRHTFSTLPSQACITHNHLKISEAPHKHLHNWCQHLSVQTCFLKMLHFSNGVNWTPGNPGVYLVFIHFLIPMWSQASNPTAWSFASFSNSHLITCHWCRLLFCSSPAHRLTTAPASQWPLHLPPSRCPSVSLPA